MLHSISRLPEYQLLDSETDNMTYTAEPVFVRIEPEFFAESRHSCTVIAGVIKDHITKQVASKIPLCQDIGYFVG